MFRRPNAIPSAAVMIGAISLSFAPTSRADDISVDQLPDSDPNSGTQFTAAPDRYAVPVEQTQWWGPWDPAQWIGQYGCPVPSAQECLSPQFAQTQCGQLDSWVATTWPGGSPCQFVVPPALEAQAAQQGFTSKLDVAMTGQPFYATDLATPVTASYFYQGAPTTYLDEMLSIQLEAKNPAAAQLFPNFQPKAVRRAEWNANGAAVGSCREFVWEKWYDWSRFEDITAGLDGEFSRFIVDRAFDAVNGIADRVIRSRNGAPQKRVVFPSELVPKNAYFLFERSAFDLYPIDASLLPDPAGRATYQPSWDWHRTMNAALAGTPDAVLASEYRRQVAFKKLLARRAELVASIVADAGGGIVVLGTLPYASLPFSVAARLGDDAAVLPSFDTSSSTAATTAAAAMSSALVSAAIAGSSTSSPISVVTDPLSSMSVAVDTGGYTGKLGQLYVLDKTLVSYLEHARDVGCLAVGAPSICDWSPTLFADQLRSQFTTERERDYDQCIEDTADDFSPASMIRNPAAQGLPFVVPGLDYTSDSEAVRAFFAIYERYVRDGLDFTPEPGSITNPAKGWWKYDNKSYGNDDWNIGYEYKIGWGLQKNSGARVGVCDADLKIQAMANATAELAGKKFNILDGDNYVYSENDVLHGHGHLKVLGKTIYDTGEISSTIHLKPLTFKLIAKPSFNTTVMIGPIPVAISVGVSGEAGIDTTIDASLGRWCASSSEGSLDLSATGTVTPFVNVAAFGAVGLGVSGVLAAKLQVELDLLHLDLPFSVSARLAPAGDSLSTLQLQLTAKFDLYLKLLSGRVLGVVETFLGDYKTELFSWPGVDPYRSPGFEKTWRIPVRSILGSI